MKPRACTASTATHIPLLQPPCPPRQPLLPSPVGDTPKGPRGGSEPPPVPHLGTVPDQEVSLVAPTLSEKFCALGAASSSPAPTPRHTWADGHGHSDTLKPHRAPSPTRRDEFARAQPLTHLRGVRLSVPPLHPGAPKHPGKEEQEESGTYGEAAVPTPSPP